MRLLGIRGAVLAAIAVVGISTQVNAQQGTSQITARLQHLVRRERWQAAGRRSVGTNSAALRSQAIRQKLQMRAVNIANPATAIVSGAWTSLGPFALPSDASGIGLQDYGWVSGRATAVAIDPNDLSGNTVYAGGAYAGVWKSKNAGAANPDPGLVLWHPLTDDQPTLAVGAIAVQPQLSNPNANTSVVLVETGETNSSGDSYYGLGILRSINGGSTWALISYANAGSQGCSQPSPGTHSFAGLGFSKIVFSSANPNLVVAATASASEGILEGLENPVIANRGLYYSTDAGISWNAANVADAGVSISASSVTSVAYNAAATIFYAAIRFHGIYSSRDGITWTRLGAQPGVLGSAPCPSLTALQNGCPIYRGEIAVVSVAPSHSGWERCTFGT